VLVVIATGLALISHDIRWLPTARAHLRRPDCKRRRRVASDDPCPTLEHRHLGGLATSVGNQRRNLVLDADLAGWVSDSRWSASRSRLVMKHRSPSSPIVSWIGATG